MFELMWTNDYYMIYPNFPHQQSLSTNHLEVGEHVQSTDSINLINRWQYTVPLLRDHRLLNSVSIPTLMDELPLFNLFGEPYNTKQSLSTLLNVMECKSKDVRVSSCGKVPYPELFLRSGRENVIIEHLHCSKFSNETYFYSSSDQRFFTISISSMTRYSILMRQIEYYTRSPFVAKILVTWHNKYQKIPRSAIVHGVPVHFIAYAGNSLNNRFTPLLQISTDAVLIMDDDIKVSFINYTTVYFYFFSMFFS
jgi:hypothetical protein